jgi:hypothetical protein
MWDSQKSCFFTELSSVSATGAFGHASFADRVQISAYTLTRTAKFALLFWQFNSGALEIGLTPLAHY